MPLRSPKMKRFIFGFQRRVWWPKWTPASNSSFIVTSTKPGLLRQLSRMQGVGGTSTLAELEARARALLAVLLALLLAGIAGQEPGRLEAVAQLAVVLEQGAGDAVADGAGLPGAAAAFDGGDDVELLRRLGEQQRLLDDHLQDFVREVVVQRAAVDLHDARAGADVDARR